MFKRIENFIIRKKTEAFAIKLSAKVNRAGIYYDLAPLESNAYEEGKFRAFSMVAEMYSQEFGIK